MIRDATGTDIGPLVLESAERHRIDPVLLLAMLYAESRLDPNAWHDGAWPDQSAGLAQMTVETAGDYGIGDGSDTPANIAAVRAVLSDRATAIEVGARDLAGCLGEAEDADATAVGDALYMLALSAYNAGSPQRPGGWWYTKYPANVANYEAALKWAHQTIGG